MRLRTHFILLLISCGIVISCTNKKDQKPDLSSVPEVSPKEITKFDKVDNIFFSHLGYESEVLNTGNILISDRELPSILLVDSDLKLKKEIREGRGPGEILDAYEFTQDDKSNIYTYDQGNKKIMKFDANMNLVEEIIPPIYDGTSIVKVYPMQNDKFLYELVSFSFLNDKEKEAEKIFVQYNPITENYEKKLVLKDRPYARRYIDDALVGAASVPFADIQLNAYIPENRTLLSFDTRTSIIAELDFRYDTLRSIPVNLPIEKLNNAELDSLKKDQRQGQWKTMQSLIPEYKSKAEKMIYYKNQIWLQSNLRGNYQKWFVLNMKGQILKIVNLPKDVMVTHVSDENIGVRMNDSEFALYKNQKLEIED